MDLGAQYIYKERVRTKDDVDVTYELIDEEYGEYTDYVPYDSLVGIINNYIEIEYGDRDIVIPSSSRKEKSVGECLERA